MNLHYRYQSYDRMKLRMIVFLTVFVSCKSGIVYPEGGYDYPQYVADKDTNFYYYPYKDKLSRKDSFNYSKDRLFWQIFNEPNLSIRPMKKDVFRFAYSAWTGKAYIVTLTENKVTIKSGYNGRAYIPNDTALTEIERKQFELLQSHFPLDEVKGDASLKKYADSMIKAYPQLRTSNYFERLKEKNKTKLTQTEELHWRLFERLKTEGSKAYLRARIDSMIRLYPQLLDVEYYEKLYHKSYSRDNKNLELSSIEIPVKKEIFDSLVNLVNASGFWKLPFEINCENPSADGDGFSLEANTKIKYQYVHVDGCSGDTSNFTKACQKLVNYVHLNKEIHLLWGGVYDTSHYIIKDVELEDIKPTRRKKH